MFTKTQEVLVHRLNLIVVAAMSCFWFTPMFAFWMQAWGPMKPFSYADIDTAPPLLGFLCGTAASFWPCLLPPSYFRPRAFEIDGRLYELVGVRWFRQFVTNGDLINRCVRLRYPSYCIVSDRASLEDCARQGQAGETSHLTLLMMGLFTAAYAALIGWTIWSVLLTATNVVFNLYPVLLQRDTRGRIERITRRRTVS